MWAYRALPQPLTDPLEREQVLDRLHAGLSRRRTCEQVAFDLLLLGVTDTLPPAGRRRLLKLARHGRRYGTHMPTTWNRHPGLAAPFAAAQTAVAQVTVAAGLPAVAPVDPTDPAALTFWLSQALPLLGFDQTPNPSRRPVRTRSNDPWAQRRPRGRRGDRLGHADLRGGYDAPARRRHLPGVSVRTYRRAVRTVAHLQQRTAVLAAQRDREAAVAFGKSRLAHTISREAFGADLPTAAFVAYYTSRLGARTEFTSGPQQRPMDTLAEDLLAAAFDSATVRADVLAAVSTRRPVLERLTAEQKGHLLGTYHEQLAACSRVLAAAFDPHRDRTTMVVRRGDDSSSWNAASRAFNSARTGWLALMVHMGLAAHLESHLPGKVPALVASDVAALHHLGGGALHPDVAVFAHLPLPWQVILDGQPCTAQQVQAACRSQYLDPEQTGWTLPYRQAYLEQPSATPELVHGVTVASPLLADALRRSGVFSGYAPPVQAWSDGMGGQLGQIVGPDLAEHLGTLALTDNLDDLDGDLDGELEDADLGDADLGEGALTQDGAAR